MNRDRVDAAATTRMVRAPRSACVDATRGQVFAIVFEVMEVKILVKWAPLMCTFWGRGCFYIFWGVLIAGAGGVAFAVLGIFCIVFGFLLIFIPPVTMKDYHLGPYLRGNQSPLSRIDAAATTWIVRGTDNHPGRSHGHDQVHPGRSRGRLGSSQLAHRSVLPPRRTPRCQSLRYRERGQRRHQGGVGGGKEACGPVRESTGERKIPGAGSH